MSFIKNSSQKAYNLLYSNLWEKHFAHAYAILGDKSLAKDVVQDVWVSLWERRDFIDNKNIEAYLLKAIKFRAYKEIRNNTYRENLVNNFFKNSNLELITSSVDENTNLQDTQNAIYSTIKKLPNRCKEVFELSREEGLKNSEIAKKLNISQRTVENHISNALKTLRSKVAALDIVLFILSASFF